MASGTVLLPAMRATPLTCRCSVDSGGSIGADAAFAIVGAVATTGTPVITAVTRPAALTTRSYVPGATGDSTNLPVASGGVDLTGWPASCTDTIVFSLPSAGTT